MNWKGWGASAALVGALAAGGAAAAPLGTIVMKIGDAPKTAGARVDPWQDWINDGGVNEGVAGATDVANAGVDYKSSYVDTNWGDVTAARVSMMIGGVEQAFIQFDTAATTKQNFFALGNVTASSWPSLTGDIFNFFSIAGDSGIDRHWFVERNYGGCGNDRGYMVVLDGRAGSCTWETSRVGPGLGDRLLAYTLPPGGAIAENWNTANVGVADVFVVSVSTTGVIPLPATLPLMLGGLLGLGLLRRRG
jgi:hypothetical protein